MTLRIAGLAHSLPKRAISSEELDRMHQKPAGWFANNTGVRCRYRCESETQLSMAKEAAFGAVEIAGVHLEEIDLVVSAAAVPYQPLPAMAPAILRELGIKDGQATAFDVNASCLSFLTALETVEALMGTGRYSCALIVSSEVASRGLPWQAAPATAGLFGDGAAAVVVKPASKATTFQASSRSYSSAYNACQIGAGGTRFSYQEQPKEFHQHSLFEMNGKELFKITSRYFAEFVDDLLAKAGWHRNDIDLIIPHQASPLALRHLIKQCSFDEGKVMDIAAAFGNQIAASIPFTLSQASAQNRLTEGMNLLFLGTAAGVSFGGVAMTC